MVMTAAESDNLVGVSNGRELITLCSGNLHHFHDHYAFLYTCLPAWFDLWVYIYEAARRPSFASLE